MSEKIDPDAPAYPVDGMRVPSMDGMTIRTRACIDLRIPATGEPWLDDLIREARRADTAAMAMQAIVAHQQSGSCEQTDRESLASCACEVADALIAELNREEQPHE